MEELDEHVAPGSDEIEEVSSVSQLRLRLAEAQVNDLQIEATSPNEASTIWSFAKSTKLQEEHQSFLGDIDATLQTVRSRQAATAAAANFDPAEEEVLSDPESHEGDSGLTGSDAVLAFAQETTAAHAIDPSSLLHADEVAIRNVRDIIDSLPMTDLESPATNDGSQSSRVDMSRIDYEAKKSSAEQCWSMQQQLLMEEMELERQMQALQSSLCQATEDIDFLMISKSSKSSEV